MEWQQCSVERSVAAELVFIVSITLRSFDGRLCRYENDHFRCCCGPSLPAAGSLAKDGLLGGEWVLTTLSGRSRLGEADAW